MTSSRRDVLKSIGGAAALALTMPGALKPAFAQQQITWKAVANHRNGASWSHRWPWLIEELKTRTDGRLAIDVSTVPELGFSGQELLRSLRSNLIDFSDIVAGFVAGEFPAIEAPQLAGVFGDYDDCRKAVDAWSAKVLSQNENMMGGRLIGSFNYNSVLLFSKFPVDDLDSLKGKKIRTFSVSLSDYITALGGEPVSLPTSDLYAALERGTIDGCIVGPDQVEGGRLYEVSKYLTNLHFGSSPGYNVISRRSWDRLPDDLKTIIDDIAPVFVERGWEAGAENDSLGLDAAEKRGMTVLRAPKDEWREPLRAIARDVVAANWAKRAGEQSKNDFNEVLAPIAGFEI